MGLPNWQVSWCWNQCKFVEFLTKKFKNIRNYVSWLWELISPFGGIGPLLFAWCEEMCSSELLPEWASCLPPGPSTMVDFSDWSKPLSWWVRYAVDMDLRYASLLSECELYIYKLFWGFPGGSVVKNLLAYAEDKGQSLVLEEPTCCGAAKPESHHYWACALEPRSRNYWSWYT